MEKAEFTGELILILANKEEWVRRIPRHLPEKTKKGEQWIWLDKNGDSLAIGEDFNAATIKDSYPVKVYRLQRVAETLKLQPKTLNKNQ